MKDYQERVVEEKKELDSKIDKLSNFLDFSRDFIALNQAEQVRMKMQRLTMKQYSDLLAARIDSFV